MTFLEVSGGGFGNSRWQNNHVGPPLGPSRPSALGLSEPTVSVPCWEAAAESSLSYFRSRANRRWCHLMRTSAALCSDSAEVKQGSLALALSRVCGQPSRLGTYRQIQFPKPQKSFLDLHLGIKLDIWLLQLFPSHSSLICPETGQIRVNVGRPMVSAPECTCAPSIMETKCSQKPGGGILLLVFLKLRSLDKSHYSSPTTQIKSHFK